MLTAEANERLTRVGKGTPMGELMRRYWHPVAGTAEMEERPTKEVRLLGEDLVLYKDRSGRYGLIDRACPHRRVNLSYGIPEEHGLRCMYHGWVMDHTGQCVEQPFEETVHPDGRFKEKVKVAGYPVQELGGMLWAYLGPEPAPLLPRWDLLVWDNVLRDIGTTVVPCNWLQCMENSLDPVHTEWLHSYLSNYVLEREGAPPEELKRPRNHGKIGFELFEHGVIKRRTYVDGTESDPEWSRGHPIVFPNYLRVGTGFQMRVPIDDEHTWHVNYNVYVPPIGVQAPAQEMVPLYDVPLYDETGRHAINFTIGQDTMAWVTQGPIAKRPLERLGESDKGIILYRKLLEQQMQVVTDGGEPLNVVRDPAKNDLIELFQEHDAPMQVPLRGRPRYAMSGQRDEKTGKDSFVPTGKWAPVGRIAPEVFAEAAGKSGG